MHNKTNHTAFHHQDWFQENEVVFKKCPATRISPNVKRNLQDLNLQSALITNNQGLYEAVLHMLDHLV